MYGVSKTEMINPANICGMTYEENKIIPAGADKPQATLCIDMAGGTRHTIKGDADEVTRVCGELVVIVRRINGDTSIHFDPAEFNKHG